MPHSSKGDRGSRLEAENPSLQHDRPDSGEYRQHHRVSVIVAAQHAVDREHRHPAIRHESRHKRDGREAVKVELRTTGASSSPRFRQATIAPV